MSEITIAVGDIHGRSLWKDIVNKERFDRIIFVGDYFDSWGVSSLAQLDNFLDILEYKKSGGKEVILLCGNHDYQYIPGINEQFSGYQQAAAMTIRHVLGDNIKKLQICYKLGNILFSHAGLTKTWLNNTGWSKKDYEDVDTCINDLFTYTPLAFHFNGWHPEGNNITQSPIWVRPPALISDAYEFGKLTQVVGHTGMKKVSCYKYRYWFIDTLGTSGEYLKIEENDHGFHVITTEHI